MRIAVIGATGFVGSHLANELVSRGHHVIGIARTRQLQTESISYFPQDIFDSNELAKTLFSCEVVVSAFNPGRLDNSTIYDEFLCGSNSIQKAVKASGAKRFIVIGNAGSLYNGDGIQIVDADDFPPEYKIVAKAARDYLDIIKSEKELDWTLFSPAKEMHKGIKTGRTGKYRIGTDFPVVNEEGRSMLSVEDVAVVIADEIENPKHHQVGFTAGY